MKTLIVNQLVRTSGTGVWSTLATDVMVTEITISRMYDTDDLDDDDKVNAERCTTMDVIIDTSTWNVKNDGLIYSDPDFKNGINSILTTALNTNDFELSYSEQGMQGNDYVNFDLMLTSQVAVDAVAKL